jgi:hypothetical protein
MLSDVCNYCIVSGNTLSIIRFIVFGPCREGNRILGVWLRSDEEAFRSRWTLTGVDKAQTALGPMQRCQVARLLEPPDSLAEKGR